MPVGNSLDFCERHGAICWGNVGRALERQNQQTAYLHTQPGNWMNLFANLKRVKNSDKLLNPFVSNRAFRLSEPVDRQRIG